MKSAKGEESEFYSDLVLNKEPTVPWKSNLATDLKLLLKTANTNAKIMKVFESILSNHGMTKEAARMMTACPVSYVALTSGVKVNKRLAMLLNKDYVKVCKKLNGTGSLSGHQASLEQEYAATIKRYVSGTEFQKLKKAEEEAAKRAAKAAAEEEGSIDNEDCWDFSEDSDSSEEPNEKHELYVMHLNRKIEPLLCAATSANAVENFKYMDINGKALLMKIKEWCEKAFLIVESALTALLPKTGGSESEASFRNALFKTKKDIETYEDSTYKTSLSGYDGEHWVCEELGLVEKPRLLLSNLCDALLSTSGSDNFTSVNKELLEFTFANCSIYEGSALILRLKDLISRFNELSGNTLQNFAKVAYFTQPFQQGPPAFADIYKDWMSYTDANQTSSVIEYDAVCSYFARRVQVAVSVNSTSETLDVNFAGKGGKKGKGGFNGREKLLQGVLDRNAGGAAPGSKGKGKGKGKGAKATANQLCYICHKKGHLSYDCPGNQHGNGEGGGRGTGGKGAPKQQNVKPVFMFIPGQIDKYSAKQKRDLHAASEYVQALDRGVIERGNLSRQQIQMFKDRAEEKVPVNGVSNTDLRHHLDAIAAGSRKRVKPNNAIVAKTYDADEDHLGDDE